MNTTNSNCTPVLPQGTLLTTITNFVKGVTKKTQPTLTPLSPDVSSAKLIGNIITVSVTVYIDSAVNVTSLPIYKGLVEFKGARPVFYVVYNYTEEIPSSLSSYTFTFDYDTKGTSTPEIETILWNEDPVLSRGTITIVS